MRGTRRLIVVGALLLSAGIAGSLALAAGDEHGKAAQTKAPAKPTSHGEGESKPAAKPAAHDEGESKPAAKATKATKAESEKAEPTKAAPAKTESTSSMSDEVPTTPDAAIEALRVGNARWVSGKTLSPNTTPIAAQSVAANGQKPFATVYTCADSRLPVERIFDRGVGDVFVLRIAGNVIGEHSTGTIEYGVEHLHTPVLVVMGHTKCGAVGAACAGKHVGGSIDSLLSEIKPAVDRARSTNPDVADDKLVEYAINENVWQSVFQLLRTSEIVRNLVTEGKIKVVGAVCDISTGKVQFLGEHPWQNQLLQAMAATESPAVAAKEAPAAATHEASAGNEHSSH